MADQLNYFGVGCCCEEPCQPCDHDMNSDFTLTITASHFRPFGESEEDAEAHGDDVYVLSFDEVNAGPCGWYASEGFLEARSASFTYDAGTDKTTLNVTILHSTGPTTIYFTKVFDGKICIDRLYDEDVPFVKYTDPGGDHFTPTYTCRISLTP